MLVLRRKRLRGGGGGQRCNRRNRCMGRHLRFLSCMSARANHFAFSIACDDSAVASRGGGGGCERPLLVPVDIHQILWNRLVNIASRSRLLWSHGELMRRRTTKTFRFRFSSIEKVTDREEQQRTALQPRFDEAVAEGKRAQFYRHRLKIDGKWV